MKRKMFAPTGNRIPNVQSLYSHYTTLFRVQYRLQIIRDKYYLFLAKNIQYRDTFRMKYLQIKKSDLFVKNNLCGNVPLKLNVQFDQNVKRGLYHN